MAVTKLMHMKEAPKNKAQHLINAVRYVLDVDHDMAKTDFGKWVGGNVGTDHDEVIRSFLETKKVFGKESGRQGYHFVISFPPGEVDEQECYNVLTDFCARYLKDEYDYLYCVHNDKEHMHGHIIFNSVSCIDGRKYRYIKGDWEKYIQPLTDEICLAKGLSPLVMPDEKVGVSYAQWLAKKKETLNWSDIIRADIDYAISRSEDMEDFLALMKKMSYTLRVGYSKKRESEYVTFMFKDTEGKLHRRRSYNITPGKTDDYLLGQISTKIRMKNVQEPYHETVTKELRQKAEAHIEKLQFSKNTKTFKRMYQAVSYYELPNPFAVPSYQVRKDMMNLERLIEECSYIEKTACHSVEMLQKRMQNVTDELKHEYIMRKDLKEQEKAVQDENASSFSMLEYRHLQNELLWCREYSKPAEETEKRLEKMEQQLSDSRIDFEKRLCTCEYNISRLKQEKRILARILKTEEGGIMLYKKQEKEIKPGPIL